MLRKELSLIINSLLVQFAAGVFSVMALVRQGVLIPGANDVMVRAAETGMRIVGPVIIVSMIISLFHLGNPFRAFRALTNIGTSWLSREILFTGGFLAFWAVFILMEIIGMPAEYIIILTSLAGIISVISMAGIYYSTGKRGWHSINTYTDFLGSIAVFGCLSLPVIMMIPGGDLSLSSGFVNKAGILLLAVPGIKFLQTLILMPALKSDPAEWNINMIAAGKTHTEKFIKMFKVLTFTGHGVSIAGGILFLAVSVSAVQPAGVFIYIAALLVITGETIARSGFYSLGIEHDGKEIKSGFRHDAYGRFITEKS